MGTVKCFIDKKIFIPGNEHIMWKTKSTAWREAFASCRAFYASDGGSASGSLRVGDGCFLLTDTGGGKFS